MGIVVSVEKWTGWAPVAMRKLKLREMYTASPQTSPLQRGGGPYLLQTVYNSEGSKGSNTTLPVLFYSFKKHSLGVAVTNKEKKNRCLNTQNGFIFMAISQ